MKKPLIALTPFIFAASLAQAQMTHDPKMMQQHLGQSTQPITIPQQAGQDVFGAISEIVDILNKDPKTDWSKVDINILRAHLLDMNEVFIKSTSETTFDNKTVIFNVKGTGHTIEAIKRMAPAHVAAMKANYILAETNLSDNGVVIKLTPKSDAEFTKLKALGFYGFLSQGSHHQPHHLMMAKGINH
jgi:hypothetical protein